uniref:Myopalladin n=1 Tax=Homo sapiens TaxID=9606 RepID=A0A8I5KSE3_HUMAN
MLTVQVKTSSAIELPDSLAFLWIIPMWNVSQAHGLYSSK